MIRLLVAEDMHVVRSALVALLSMEEDFEVVAEVGRGDLVLGAVERTRPDVALLDLDMPGQNGIAVAGELARSWPQVRVVILTGVGRPGSVKAALEAGARGFVLKTASARALVEGVRTVAEGGQVLDASLAAAALRLGTNPLRPREQELLDLVASGCSVRESAQRLFLSEGTVRNYLSAIVDKLGARGRVDAIRIAQENGWM